MMGLYRDSGKENGYYYIGFRVGWLVEGLGLQGSGFKVY